MGLLNLLGKTLSGDVTIRREQNLQDALAGSGPACHSGQADQVSRWPSDERFSGQPTSDSLREMHSAAWAYPMYSNRLGWRRRLEDPGAWRQWVARSLRLRGLPAARPSRSGLPRHVLSTGRPVLIRVLGDQGSLSSLAPLAALWFRLRKRAPHGCGVTTVDQAAAASLPSAARPAWGRPSLRTTGSPVAGSNPA